MENRINKIEFSEKSLAKAQEIIKRYPEGKQKSALLPLLHMAQEELGNGWLSVPVMDYVASLLNIQPIEVYEVASFYTMFYTKPVGKHVLEVCQTSPCCHLRSDDMIRHLVETLGVKVGQTTSDGMFTIKPVECLASCGSAPVMQVGEYYYENLNEKKIDELIAQLRKKPYPLKEKIM